MSDNNKKIEGFNLSYQPEIIRSNQKDEEYQQYTYQKLIQGIEIFIPHLISYRTITKYKSHLKLLSSMLYFGFTTLSDIKTFGEEFSGITQINEQDFVYEGILTNKKRKILLFISSTIFQFLFRKKCEGPYNSYRDKSLADPHLYPKIWDSCIRNLPDFEGIIDKIFKLNLTLFFIRGDFLQIAKRFQNINYVFTKSLPKHNINYSKIGKLVMVQIAIEFFRYIYHVIQDQKQVKKIIKQKEEELYEEEQQDQYNQQQQYMNQDSDNSYVEQEDQCGVCFDKRNGTTATPCGHLFCWECVLQYVNMKNECPNCRQKCLPQKLVQLRNYA